ncbi:aminomethyl-transferring glycine dehydrogenase [Pseudomaricurvus alkylphenolicus]|uniref:aminomethyl-transferring glycine dehydrogenase n=1 Tax=Pseudomaricurvus alkylphenolicus TaxID=1306991 RepID=UPI00141DA71C|nr:aminomethyl-transferring glycine dehydrogenase [Pseudomaricurvus alkylphenolicus]NIB40203.1 aminomethyl-transferring glycine dehydrogenase [Pseudomaricurvus alkylphenolicus]
MTNNTGFDSRHSFVPRHIGPASTDQQQMLNTLGYNTLSDFIGDVIPDNIRLPEALALEDGLSEIQALKKLKALAEGNQVLRSFIGQGYYNTHTPNVILRNVMENPAWYTAYTPYQPEISQGRLEALLNYQTMVCDLTGMELANASMLDEATAAAEAMTLCQRMSKSKSLNFFVDQDCLPQTIDVIQTRAEPLDINVIIGNPSSDLQADDVFGVLLQYPGASGQINDYRDVIDAVHAGKGLVAMAADILALTLLASPAELGADVAIGSTQRFGVPLGYGGPHAAYMATREKYKRSLPGRLVGRSVDSQGNEALRLALQTREQHIRREKATSNICTAQVLLAVMASMYAVYHGPEGLKAMAESIHAKTSTLAGELQAAGLTLENNSWFDTLTVNTGDKTADIHARALSNGINLRVIDDSRVGVSLDETVEAEDLQAILSAFGVEQISGAEQEPVIPAELLRNSDYLTHPVFSSYHSETEMLRYLRGLADKDLALDRAMIPLGSCTMKLNATAEMIPVTWPEFSSMHPFVPTEQAEGYRQLDRELNRMLCEATGYDDISFQPNAGSQGEYAGLLAIRGYHESRGEGHRNICLIPSSAHGTNPASAQMCGMKVVVTACDSNGEVDMADLKAKTELHSDNLAAIMITYPSTHGVFEENVREICELIHSHGGQVYVDGANFNAMVGLCKPGKFGGDVSHLNLHKTFCIPHGGGGPGVGPVAVKSHLAPYLPGHAQLDNPTHAVSAAQLGSASILPITWMYITMMGAAGLQSATELAILNANYVAKRLSAAYPILYTGNAGLVAHECIVDLRPIKEETGVDVEDVAKRLIDYGFHAPTMSFPVAGTLMIEPTESESLYELDRFCDALLKIGEEIQAVRSGEVQLADSPLVSAPHTVEMVSADEWDKPYPRSQGGFPLESLRQNKYWPPVGRIDNVYGDRNLACSCAPIEAYMES